MGKLSDMFEQYAQGFVDNDKEKIFGIPHSSGQDQAAEQALAAAAPGRVVHRI